jgi:hypothetical protein
MSFWNAPPIHPSIHPKVDISVASAGLLQINTYRFNIIISIDFLVLETTIRRPQGRKTNGFSLGLWQIVPNSTPDSRGNLS